VSFIRRCGRDACMWSWLPGGHGHLPQVCIAPWNVHASMDVVVIAVVRRSVRLSEHVARTFVVVVDVDRCVLFMSCLFNLVSHRIPRSALRLMILSRFALICFSSSSILIDSQ
jgi:hypothetical protein